MKLVVLDSITFPLRLNIRDTRVRNGLISYIGQTLVQIANKQEVAVNHSCVFLSPPDTLIDSCTLGSCDKPRYGRQGPIRINTRDG